MAKISLPYGKRKLTLELPDHKLAGILLSQAHDYKAEGTEGELVQQALDNPIGSPPLRELCQGKKNIVIISSDHTRPVPSHVTMPLLLAEIRRGNPEAQITILVATGYHRASTDAELRQKYGDKIVDEERIVIHNAFDESSMVRVGTLPSGGDLVLNKLALEADLLIAEGFIEPHFFAGFSGGRKSVLPGLASKTTVLANHCASFIDHPRARAGILDGNPIHRDMLYAAEQAKLAFILNVVIDADKKVIKAFAGHFDQAHRVGCQFVSQLASVQAKPADIVITTNGGYPLDQNIYQAVKGMTAAEASCKEGGVIISVSQCMDGHGGQAFYEAFASSDSVEKIYAEVMKRNAQETQPDQWEIQILARILLKHQVIMVTEAPQEMVENMHMKWAASLDEAVELAKKLLGKPDYSFTVIPDGVSVIVKQ